MLLKPTKDLLQKYICVYIFFSKNVLCVTMVFFSYKKAKLQTKLCVQTGYNMFSILVVWYFYRQNKTHQLYCKYWTPSVHIIQTLIFLFVYFWPTASHFYAYRSHRWNIHKVEKKSWAGWWPNLICMRLLFVLLK